MHTKNVFSLRSLIIFKLEIIWSGVKASNHEYIMKSTILMKINIVLYIIYLIRRYVLNIE